MESVTDILVGNINPSAKVSDTYATDSFSSPAIDGPAGFGSGKYITDYTQLNSSEKTTTSESCIAWPAEVVVADTWNVELAEEMGKAVGEEGLWAAA